MLHFYTYQKANYSPLLFILLFFFSILVNAQTPVIRDLKAALEDSPTFIEKAEIYNELAWESFVINYDTSLAYADTAIHFSRQLSDKSLLADAYMRAADALEWLGKLSTASTYADSSFMISKRDNNKINMARAENRVAALQRQLINLDVALSHSRNAVSIYGQVNEPEKYATAMATLANIFNDKSEFDSSIFYHDKSLQIRRELKLQSAIAESLLNLGNLYWGLNNPDRALVYNRESLSIYQSLNWANETSKVLMNMGNAHYDLNDLDSSEIYNQKSLEIRENNSKLAYLAHYNYNNLGNIEMARKNWKEAMDYHSKAYDFRKENDSPELFISELNLGNIERLNKRYKKAETLYESALSRVDSLNVIMKNPQILLWLSSVSSALDKDSIAQAYLGRYSSVLKEINLKVSRANNLESELEDIRNKARINRVLSEKQQITIYALIGGIVLVILLFFVILRLSQMRNKNQLIKQKEALQREKIQQLIKEKEIEAMNAMVEGQENERLRIARDLHDRLGGTLSIVKMHFKSVEESIEELKDKNVKQYKEANNLLDEACEEVRKIAHDMSSGVLMKFGLVAALEDLKATVETAGQLKMNLIDIGLEERLDYDHEINIYRIIQELLTNTLKHANAQEMSLQLFRKQDRLNIVVEDDGIGFDPDQIVESSGMGLASIENRVQKFDGEMNIDSGKGAGTTVTIDLPIKYEKL